MVNIRESLIIEATRYLNRIRNSAREIDRSLMVELNSYTDFDEQTQIRWLISYTDIEGPLQRRFTFEPKILWLELMDLQGLVDHESTPSYKVDTWLKLAAGSTASIPMRTMFMLLLKKAENDRRRMKQILMKNPKDRTGLTLWEWIESGNIDFAIEQLQKRSE